MRNLIAKDRAMDMLVTALGEQIVGALGDPAVTEIMMNPDGRLWIERLGEGRRAAGSELSSHEVERVIRLVATSIGQDVNAQAPLVSAELPLGGERFEGVLPPVSPAPCFSIRKPIGKVLTLDDYVRDGVIDSLEAGLLQQAIAARRNILIVGGTGSGKTTLANALLAEIARCGDRVVILEDTRELQCAAEDVVQLRTQISGVTLRDLVRSTLRLRPDRIIIGEVRGGEALDMLKAWNTGHPGGIATLHANSAEAGLQRLEQLIGEASRTIPYSLIAEAIDCIVFIQRASGHYRVSDLLEVQSHEAGRYVIRRMSAALALVAGDNPIPATIGGHHD